MLSETLAQALDAMAQRHGWDPKAIAAVIHVETVGTFSPSIRNPASGATGLIQFMPATARALGTSTEELARMSAVEQLPFVERYLEQTLRGRRHLRRVDYYLAVFYPAAIGLALDTPFLREGSKEYEANRQAFDREGKGYIEPADLDRALARVYGQPVPTKKKSPQGGS